MDVVVSIGTSILNKLVDEAILQACYPFRFNHYVKELETEKENLHSKIQEVLDLAKDAKKKTHKVNSKVEKWLYEADFLMAKVVQLQEKTKKRNKTSCLKRCPNLITRYNLAKQLEEKTKEIKKHNQVEFLEFSRLATLVGLNYFSSQDFVHFDSRKAFYDDLLKALKDDENHMIGLYGMGGCGKTTLVKEVGKESEKFFDNVVFVVVSRTFDVRKIQSKIASQLKLELREKENLERAQRLFMRLTSGERFLIILDDVWEKLDFVDIGIPIANNKVGCTTLITTRKFHVCESMSCQKIIHLKGLNGDESWALFQKHAGLFDDHSDNMKDMAQNITKVCDGLPIAIAAVANALKDKPHNEWVEALKILRDPSWIDIEEGLKSTYGCLRLSYDNLENEAVKSLFLLCSVYPEDYDIPIDELTIIGLGLGLVGEIPSYWAKIQMINKAIKKLVGSCLLLKVSEGGSHVKMHDLVHDVALWIARKENKLIMGQLKEDMTMKDHPLRYLWLEEVDKCPNKLNCAQLEFLHISIYSEPYVTIPNDFFNGMGKLRVLFLENPTDQEDLVLQLPISLHLINNLCCLMLYCRVLGDISFIWSLERLESLTIWDCSFDELAEGIILQKKLRLLDLRSYKIERNPFEVMGRCSQLEVLYFCGNGGTDWEDQNNNSAEFFNQFSTIAPTLQSYCMHFGNRDEDFFLHKRLWYCNSFVARSLYIENFENCISVATSKDMMRRAKTLSLRRIPRSWKNIIPDLWQTIGGGMDELTHLALHDSDGIECVIGRANYLSPVGIISNLTYLTLTQVKHMKILYIGEPPQGLFANLENLRIQSCDSLQHILTEDGKEIVDGSECQRYKNAFPKLKTLETCNCKQLEYLMPISFAKSLAHLETLSVVGNDELRSVFGQSLYEDLNVNKPRIIEFSALENLLLVDMPNIVGICPENYHPTWPSLKLLQLDSCPQLNIKSINHWVACGGLRQEDMQMSSEELVKVVMAPLKTLRDLYLFNDEVEVVFDVEQLPINGQVNSSLRDLLFGIQPQLRHIWRGPKNCLLLQHLERLQLVSCECLKEVFPSSILKSLPQLRDLYIVDCNGLEEIIEEDDQNVLNSHQFVFPRLASIYIKRCHNLKCIFPNISGCQVIPNLRVLAIEDASMLEQAFGHEQHDTTQTYEVVTPSLEYVLLWNLPLLTSVVPSIDLQTVKYIVVQQCPKLSLTSSVTPQELLKQLSKGYLDERYELKTGLEDIIKSMDDSIREITQPIVCKEIGSQNNDQKLKFIASPNLTEIAQGRAEECSTSENIEIFTSLSHPEPKSSTKRVYQIMPGLKISAAMPTSLLQPKSISKQSTCNSLDTSPHKTTDDETDVKGNFESPPSYENAKTITLSTDPKLASLPPGILVTATTNTVPHIQSQIKFNPRKLDVEDVKDDDLIGVLESIEDDYGGKLPISSDPTVAIAKDELVAKALNDLENFLKMPLKDIATSEANSLRLQTALNFLTRLSLEDGALSHGVMAIIKSMHKDFPNILSSFKQAFATANKFAVLEERDKSIKDKLSRRKEVALALVSKMSEAQKFLAEAQDEEARLKEKISRLEKQRKDCEAELSSLQVQKRKYVAEAIEFKKEIEVVRKERSEMVDDQRNARQQVFQIDHKWSVICSQFELAITKKHIS